MSVLEVGDWVEVPPADVIVASLDRRGALEGLPFMPEMLPFCGGRFRVAMRAERTCVRALPAGERPIRRLDGAVVLEDLRCDGARHGGCQLGCMLYWKEAWLRRAHASQRPTAAPAVGARDTDRAATQLPVRQAADPDAYYCQGTELARATRPGPPLWDPLQYVRMVRVGTLTVPQLVRMYARIGVSWATRQLERRRPASARGQSVAGDVLGLRPGEWVEVKSKAEILRTLDENRALRGLGYVDHLDVYCGRRLRVRERVERVVAEETGRLRAVRDTVILEGAACPRHQGCARGMPPLWREAWLRRVEEGAS